MLPCVIWWNCPAIISVATYRCRGAGKPFQSTAGRAKVCLQAMADQGGCHRTSVHCEKRLVRVGYWQLAIFCFCFIAPLWKLPWHSYLCSQLVLACTSGLRLAFPKFADFSLDQHLELDSSEFTHGLTLVVFCFTVWVWRWHWPTAADWIGNGHRNRLFALLTLVAVADLGGSRGSTEPPKKCTGTRFWEKVMVSWHRAHDQRPYSSGKWLQRMTPL